MRSILTDSHSHVLVSVEVFDDWCADVSGAENQRPLGSLLLIELLLFASPRQRGRGVSVIVTLEDRQPRTPRIKFN